MCNKLIRVVAHYAAYTLSTRIAPPLFFNYNAFDCKTTLRDKKVNIQAPCGGTRDPYFMRFQHSPPLQCRLHFLHYSFLSLSLSPSFCLCCCVTLWRKYVCFTCLMVDLQCCFIAPWLDLKAFWKLQGATWCKSLRHSLQFTCT